jgi:hypothetical protein
MREGSKNKALPEIVWGTPLFPLLLREGESEGGTRTMGSTQSSRTALDVNGFRFGSRGPLTPTLSPEAGARRKNAQFIHTEA